MAVQRLSLYPGGFALSSWCSTHKASLGLSSMRIACMQCTLETEAVVHMFCHSVCWCFLKWFILLSHICICVCPCPCKPEMSESLKPGLQAVVNFLIYVLGTKLWSLLRTVGFHNCWTISSNPRYVKISLSVKCENKPINKQRFWVPL